MVRDERVLIWVTGAPPGSPAARADHQFVKSLRSASEAEVVRVQLVRSQEDAGALQVEKCITAYTDVLTHGWAPHQIVIGGGEDDGVVAMRVVLALLERGYPVPAGCLIMAPNCLVNASKRSWCGAPPLLVLLGSSGMSEVCARSIADDAASAGVDVQVLLSSGRWETWLRFPSETDCREAVDDAAGFISWATTESRVREPA